MIYPSKETNRIAPGSSIEIEILFKANSLADFDDEIIFISDKNNFRVKTNLKARFL